MIRWGILGAGNIARRFAASLRQQPDSVLAAISCRSKEKADSFAFPVARAYVGHDKLLEDPEIDAIYLALPHGLHCEWAVKALRAGKAVLCEKPAALNAEEMRTIAAAAKENQVLFMEAMKPRFVPLYRKLRTMLKEGVIGDLTGIEASLCNQLPAEMAGKTYHTEPSQGGALLDCGCYCASWLEDFLPGDPTLTRIAVNQQDNVDYYVRAQMQFGACAAVLECAFDRAKPRQVVLRGTKGHIVVEDLHRPQTMTIHRDGQETQTITEAYVVDDFYGEIDHFVQTLKVCRTESAIMPLSASIRSAEILDTIRNGLVYTPESLAVLQQQELLLQYDHFGSSEALALGCAVAELAKDYDRGVAVRITREKDGLVLFQYMMDDKAPRNETFLEGKRQAALSSGHSSLWPYVAHAIDGDCQDVFDNMPKTLPFGGAFPIRANGEWVATLAVSGLHEGMDHELAVRALAHALGREIPSFPKAAV